ncbi:hypothetical protein N7528_000855 [Penicillium herquei]|nr:hypothetical protein N7528_000855 [Penicillium herquei]
MPKADRSEFDATQATLTETLATYFLDSGVPPDAVESYKKCLLNNIQGGKLYRCSTVLDTAKILKNDHLTEKQKQDLIILGWSIEILNAAVLVWDDIMDGSITRRGKPCWYRREEIGMMAVNDGCLLNSTIYIILKIYFKAHPSYHDLVELFQETALQVGIGQSYDLLTASRHSGGLSQFTQEKYEFITERKTTSYTFYAPLVLPLIYLQLATPKNLKEVWKIALHLGQYYQAHNDYTDVFADPSITGKMGNDIQENKMTWLILEALQRCNQNQRGVLETFYGSQDIDEVMKVQGVFRELDLDKAFQQWSSEKINTTRKLIEGVDESEGLNREVFNVFLCKLVGNPPTK